MNNVREKQSPFKLAILIAFVLLAAAALAVGTFYVVADAEGGGYNASEPEASMMTLRSGESRSGAVVLNATVSPAGSEAAGLTWSAAWKNSSSAFAKANADPTAFISLTPNGTSCTVELIAPFGEQIIITVVSNSNPDAKASCTVDYQQKLLGQEIVVSSSSEHFVTNSNVSAGDTFVARPLWYSRNVVEAYSEKLTFDTLMDEVYTIGETVTSATARIFLTDEFFYIVEKYFEVGQGDMSAVPIDELTWADVFNRCGVGNLVPTSTSETTDMDNWNAFNEAAVELGDRAALQIEVTVVTGQGTEVFEYFLKFDTLNVQPYALEIHLDESSIIF